MIITFEPNFFQNVLSLNKYFFLVFFSFIKTHHLFLNKFLSPCSAPLTSDPAIG